ncbi:MAG: hypothetical protein HC871_04780, partial [Rhizobiales bacterium]|nr:hypothetical protein [Hyphomicrobiales bacterium]
MAMSSIVSPLRPKVIEPGMPALDAGVERYTIRGGGAIVIALEPGDRLEITDIEGRQPASWWFFRRLARVMPALSAPRARHRPWVFRQFFRRIAMMPRVSAPAWSAALDL